MKTELDKKHSIETSSTVNLPAGSLWHDLRAEIGHGCGIEWLLLYEDDPLTIKPCAHLRYAKVIIQTAAGRKAAENGQAEILSKCKLRLFDTAALARALAVAMTIWDSEH